MDATITHRKYSEMTPEERLRQRLISELAALNHRSLQLGFWIQDGKQRSARRLELYQASAENIIKIFEREGLTEQSGMQG